MGKSSTKAAKPAKVEAPVKAATKDKKMKDVSAKVEKKSKKAKKEPTPEPSDSSESEESASSESESSEEEVEVKKPVVKANGTKKAAAKKEESSDETSEGTSDESSEDEAPAAKKSKTNGVGNLAAKQAEADASADESSSDEEGVDAGVLGAAPTVQEAAEDSDDSDESDSSEDEKPAKKAAAKPAAKDDDEEDEDSDDEDSSDEEEEKPASKAKDNKRKAEAEPEMPERAKKIAKADAGENSGSKNLFVGNLSWNVDEAWLRQEFESFGELTGVRIMIDRATNRSKGFGYVEFANADDAAKAHAERKGYELDGRALNVDFANAKPDNSGAQADRRKQYGDQLSEPTATLFIGNISFEVGQEEVTSAFGEVASVVSCRLPTDQETGAPKGFGYIEFNSVEDATSALNTMQGHYLGNRPIRLDYSQPRPDRGDGGRGGGRGGFGGRGRGGDRGGRGGRGGSFGGRGGRGGFGDRGGRGGRGGARGGRGGSTNRGGFGDFSGVKQTFD